MSLAPLYSGIALVICLLLLNVAAICAIGVGEQVNIYLAIALADYNLEGPLENDKQFDYTADCAFSGYLQTKDIVFHLCISNPSICKKYTLILSAPRSPPVRQMA